MKKLALLLFAMLTICSASAQETVKLTVNGQGATKEEATANALRSAIEQSFGVFVSANTQILNDEVVKDEIATIASGNIQEYQELGCITMPNGQQSVTLSATVSIGNLISYAKSKGSSAEFAGQVFAMNMKMRKLNAENEANAIHHMLQQLSILAPDLFRVELSITQAPKKRYLDDGTIKTKKYNISLGANNYYDIPITLNYYTTKTSKAFFNLLINTLKSLALSETEVKEYYNSNERIYGCGESYVNIGLENLKFRTPTIDESFKYFIENAIAVAVFSAYDIEILGLNESHRLLYDTNENYAKLSGGRPIHTTGAELKDVFTQRINLTKLNSENLLTIAMDAEILFTEDECSKITQIKIQKNDDALLHACIMFGQYYGLQQYFKFKEIESAYTFYGSYMEFHSSHYSIKHEDGWSDWITKPTKITYDIISRTWNVQEFGTLPEYEYRTNDFMYWGNYKHGCLISKRNNSKDLSIRIDGLETNNGKPHSFFIPTIETEKFSSSDNVSSSSETNQDDDLIYLKSEENPSFQNGDLSTFRQWMQGKIVWPKEAQEKGIKGRVVFSFVVEKDGSISNFTVMRSPDKLLTNEVERVLKLSPKWEAGKMNGQKVRVKLSSAVDF